MLPNTQFRYWYREWAKEVSPVMHFTHKAGDKLFIDFTGKKLSIVDRYTGEIQDLEVFVCVLGSSQYTYVEACESQKKLEPTDLEIKPSSKMLYVSYIHVSLRHCVTKRSILKLH